MKNTIKLLMVSFSLFIAAISNVSANNLSQTNLANAVYNRLEFKQNLPVFTNRYIDRIANSRNDVPANVWTQIKNSIDYTSVEENTITALNSNYSSSELQALINDNANEKIIPITKLTFRNELSNIVQEFSEGSLVNQINQKLSSLGYNTI